MKQLKMWTSESFTFSSLNTTSMPITDLTIVIFLSVNFPYCLRIFKIAFLSFTLCMCVYSSLKCTQFLKKSIHSLCEKWKDFSSELHFCFMLGFPCDSAGIKNLPVMEETWVWSLGWEDSLEKGKATTTHSRILAWRIPWTI